MAEPGPVALSAGHLDPSTFVNRWRHARLGERAGAQAHFLDLCRLLDEPAPHDADPEGIWYTFEKGAARTGFDTRGWADVWKRHCFAWEYKGRHKDLDAAFAQLQRYAIALENPPLLVVSDMATIRIHTNFTNTVQTVHRIGLDDLLDGGARRLLKQAFTEPEALRPGETRQAVTEKAAAAFGDLAQRLRRRTDAAGAAYDPQRVAHFVNKLVFCMFAEDIGLLPEQMFSRMLDAALARSGDFPEFARSLFGAMRDGGHVGFTVVPWFDGGLFADDDVLPLDRDDLLTVRRAAALDWSDIEPSIFGTLFERGLDPDKRTQVGAYYTDPDKIMKIVEPVVLRPLQADWDTLKAELTGLEERKTAARSDAAKTRAENRRRAAYEAFRQRLADYRVLDPACGSGNFLYLALLHLKDFELKVTIEAEAMGLPRGFPRIGPEAVKGIEINPYAAELARLTVWIGQIQWQLRNGFGVDRSPILRPLDQIECRDALLNPDGSEADWPAVDAIIGNPPFLGDKLFITYLGEAQTALMRRVFHGRVPGGADLVCYWLEKGYQALKAGRAQFAGFVATNSVRGGANRFVTEKIVEHLEIFDAWDDDPWILDGAAVRVAMICYAGSDSRQSIIKLNGMPVDKIHSDLSAALTDLTKVVRLSENKRRSFIGMQKNGAFDIAGDIARGMIHSGRNPNKLSNEHVLKPWSNGKDVTDRHRDFWIIDYGCELDETKASEFEMPFEHIKKFVKPKRSNIRRSFRRKYWWRLGEPMPALRQALHQINHYIATPRISKHRVFVWKNVCVLPDCQIVVIAREDDVSFGILHSRFHELWSLRLGTSLEDRPRYTPSTTFETFPFPEGLTPDIPAADYADDPRALAIAEAARELDEKREAWLNPPDLVDRVPEVVPGYPDRLIPKTAEAARILKKRTLTNLYNERPAWLDALHRRLDAAVARAYGWPEDISDDDALARLFALNQSRAARRSGPAPR